MVLLSVYAFMNYIKYIIITTEVIKKKKLAYSVYELLTLA